MSKEKKEYGYFTGPNDLYISEVQGVTEFY
jgi:hypothetical protein